MWCEGACTPSIFHPPPPQKKEGKKKEQKKYMVNWKSWIVGIVVFVFVIVALTLIEKKLLASSSNATSHAQHHRHVVITHPPPAPTNSYTMPPVIEVVSPPAEPPVEFVEPSNVPPPPPTPGPSLPIPRVAIYKDSPPDASADLASVLSYLLEKGYDPLNLGTRFSDSELTALTTINGWTQASFSPRIWNYEVGINTRHGYMLYFDENAGEWTLTSF
jgi:hypothetical protein